MPVDPKTKADSLHFQPRGTGWVASMSRGDVSVRWLKVLREPLLPSLTAWKQLQLSLGYRRPGGR